MILHFGLTKTAVLLQVRSTKLSVSSRRNAHFHKTACSPHRLVASRLANLTVLMLFGATLGPRLPQQKRQFRTRLSLILFSLIRKRPQDLKSCKTIVFYKPKSPSGSKASCFYTFLCGPKKVFQGSTNGASSFWSVIFAAFGHLTPCWPL